MPDVVVFWRTPVVGPGGYPVSPGPSRVSDESLAWLDRKVEFDAPYSQVFLLANKVKFRTWTLDYGLRPKADLDAIRDFWKTVEGMVGTFKFTHPVTSTVYRARFARPVISWEHDPGPGTSMGAPQYSFSVSLEEAP